MAFRALLGNYAKGPPKEEKIVELPKPAPFAPVWSSIEQFVASKQLHSNHKVVFNQPVVGVVIIIIDNLPNEKLWRRWLEDSDCRAKVWIHAKHPNKVRSPWVQERLVKLFHLRPGWGSLDLTKVMLCLLFEAMQDVTITCSHFIFASESCLPIQPFSELIKQLATTEGVLQRSWMVYKNRANNGYAQQQQFDVIAERIPLNHVVKADQWLLLSHKHVHVIFRLLAFLHNADSLSTEYSKLTIKDIQKSKVWSVFHGVRASDEMFFPSVLSMLNLLNEDTEIDKRRVTYADWEGMTHSPRLFSRLFVAEHARQAKAENCIFMRKCQVSTTENSLEEESYVNWHRVVYGSDPVESLPLTGVKRSREEEKNDEEKEKKQIVSHCVDVRNINDAD